MNGGGLCKLGWHWTRKGWKRSPKHLLAVKKVPLPTKRKTRKKVRIAAAPKRTQTPAPEAPQLAAEQGRADSAPTPRAGGREASLAPAAGETQALLELTGARERETRRKE